MISDRIAKHYDRHARAFESARRKAFDERHWLERFAMPLRRGGHVLDLGCGGGEPIARFLIDAGFHLTGVDLSEKLIALARTRFPRHRWLRADMRAAMMDRKFDGVIAWNSLIHLAPIDQAALVARMAAWLDPGGMMLFSAGLASVPASEGASDDALYHASLDPADYRLLFGELGLLEVAFVPEDPAAGGRTVWLARKQR